MWRIWSTPGRCVAKRAAVVDHAADRHAAEADAVIAALAADQAGARRLPGGAMIGQRDLQRGIDRFRTRIGEEDAVEPIGAISASRAAKSNARGWPIWNDGAKSRFISCRSTRGGDLPRGRGRH